MYTPRIIDQVLSDHLGWSGAVIIEGPKACGKTATAKQIARSAALMDTDPEMAGLMELDPAFVLRGEAPRLIDEWQIAPSIWNYVRREVDDRSGWGHFILTGSAVPPDDATRHSGAGRFSRIQMRPMSLFETGHSSGEISLREILCGVSPNPVRTELAFRELCSRIVIGGWPAVQGAGEAEAQKIARNYLSQVSRADITNVDGIERDPTKVSALLRSIARNTATEAKISTLTSDVGGSEALLTRQTASHYLEALERIFVLEKQPAWAPHLRSKAKLRRGPKLHLVDPSLAAAALRADAERLYADLETVGFLFESLAHRDLLAYCLPIDGTVSHYRDSDGLEIDMIVEAPDHGWGAFEIKLSPGSVDVAAHSLLRFADKVDTARVGQPKNLAVIVGGGHGYTRKDGVVVIPIGALGP